MNILKKKLKKSACVGFKSRKEDCNISNFSEFQTVDSGIVSDQSSRLEHQQSHTESCFTTTSRKKFASYDPRINGNIPQSPLISQNYNDPNNLSSITENHILNPLYKSNRNLLSHNKVIDFGPIHPYMSAIPFCSYQYSDAYNSVASASSDDSKSMTSELFIPLNKASRRFVNKENRSEKDLNKFSFVQTSEEPRWDRLPSMLLIKIFKYLSIDDIGKCSQVCINWYFIAWQPAIWDVINLSKYAHGHRNADINRAIRNVFSLLGGIKTPMCPLVHTIKLEKCIKINDDSLILISNSCQNLKVLNVRKCGLLSNIAIFHILSKCIMLTKLNVEECKLISSINTLPDAGRAEDRIFCLSELNLSNCPLIDDASLSILTYKFRNLNKLLIRNCKRVTDIGLEYVARYCSKMHELSFNNLPKICDEAIINISLKMNVNLHYLSLANCCLITDRSLNHLSDNCHNLRYLNLHKCKLITDSGVMSLAISVQSSLVSLSLSYCDKITNKTLSVISRYCSKLQQLDLNHCVNITDEGLVESCKHFNTLNLINIDNTSATVKSFDFISKKFPKCGILHNFITDC